MRLKTTIKNIPFELCDQTFCENGNKRLDFIEEKVSFHHPDYGDMNEIQTVAGAYLVNFLKVNLVRSIDVELFTDEPAMQMFFFMKGPANMMHHQIRSLKPGTRLARLPAVDSELEYLSVTIPEKHYKSLVDSLNLGIEFFSGSFREMPEDLVKQCEVLTPEMLTVVRDIGSCERIGHFRRMYVEAKVTELLLLQVEQLTQNQKISTVIPQLDIDRMHHARELIVQDFTTPCSLINLARKVGTNEFKLKKYFKQLFGTTVFGYVTELKMHEAKQLLQRDELSIYQVAESLGFKCSNHFSTAFRKYHGYTPSEVKKQNSYLESKLTMVKST